MLPQNKSLRPLFVLLLASALWSGCTATVAQRQEPHDKGWVTRAIFDRPLYEPFKNGYDTSKVAGEYVELMKTVVKDVDITVFFGGWCSDSKRQVPHFLKIADAAGIPSDHIRFYALDRTKKSDDSTTDHYRIERVPTFIFSRDGAEVGRITESPQTTLEADMLAILFEGLKH